MSTKLSIVTRSPTIPMVRIEFFFHIELKIDLFNLIYNVHLKDLKGSLEELVYQLFDFILILKEKSKYKSTIKKAIDELCFYAINYMQITDEQVSKRIFN